MNHEEMHYAVFLKACTQFFTFNAIVILEEWVRLEASSAKFSKWLEKGESLNLCELNTFKTLFTFNSTVKNS